MLLKHPLRRRWELTLNLSGGKEAFLGLSLRKPQVKNRGSGFPMRGSVYAYVILERPVGQDLYAATDLHEGPLLSVARGSFRILLLQERTDLVLL
jgi:hypothetical protein